MADLVVALRRGAGWTADEEVAGSTSNLFAMDGTSLAASAEAVEDGGTSDTVMSSDIAAGEALTDSDGMGRDRYSAVPETLKATIERG